MSDEPEKDGKFKDVDYAIIENRMLILSGIPPLNANGFMGLTHREAKNHVNPMVRARHFAAMYGVGPKRLSEIIEEDKVRFASFELAPTDAHKLNLETFFAAVKKITDWPTGVVTGRTSAVGQPIEQTIPKVFVIDSITPEMEVSMIVGVTATREGMNERQKAEFRQALIDLKATELHHGDCLGGDEDAHNIAMDLGLRIVIHPPDNDKMRAFCKGANQVMPPLPYLKRNHKIVDASNVLLGCPQGETGSKRSGTWDTLRYAEKKSKPHYIIGPIKTRKFK